MATYCLACQEAAAMMQINISAGITFGNAVIGVIGLENRNVNVDIYGDVINMSARVAKYAPSGIHFALKDAEGTQYYKVDRKKTMSRVRTQGFSSDGEMNGMTEYRDDLHTCNFSEVE